LNVIFFLYALQVTALAVTVLGFSAACLQSQVDIVHSVKIKGVKTNKIKLPKNMREGGSQNTQDQN
jgi:hypothetical protein